MPKGGHGAKSAGKGGKRSAPGMREAWRLLDAGDVRAARREAARILAGASGGATAGPSTGAPPPGAELEEAKELLARTRFPKEALAAAAIAATLVALLILLAVLRG